MQITYKGDYSLKAILFLSLNHDRDVVTINATVSYNYSDEITDPINHRQRRFGYHSVADLPDFYKIDSIPEEYREGVAETLAGADLFFTDMLVGNAYSVTGEWKTKITGSVFVKPKPEKDQDGKEEKT